MNKNLRASWKRRAVCLICLFAVFCVIPVCADGVSVSHKINQTSVPLSGDVLVTLSVNNMDAGGLIEIIPEGFAFLDTSYPADRYQISGQELIFSVIGEQEITYQARAEKAGSWVFSGSWHDIMNKKEGTIQAITITAGSAASAQVGDVDRDQPVPSGTGGAAEITLILAAFGACACIARKQS